MGFKDFIGDTWNSIKSGLGNAKDWYDKNKSSILYYGGKVAANSGIPVISGLGVAATAAGEIMQEGEAKEAYQKELEQQRMRQYGNRCVAYSDMPRIHYSKKPYSYVSHHHPNFNRRETFDDVLKNYVANKNARLQKKEKEEKQKNSSLKQKEKWKRQAQNKKEKEEKQKQQKIANENIQEKAKAENRKLKAESPKLKPKAMTREESLKQTKNDIALAFKMGYIYR